MQPYHVQDKLESLLTPKALEMRSISDSEHIAIREIDDKVPETTRRVNYCYGYIDAINDMLDWMEEQVS